MIICEKCLIWYTEYVDCVSLSDDKAHTFQITEVKETENHPIQSSENNCLQNAWKVFIYT